MLYDDLIPCGVYRDNYGDLQVIFGKDEGNGKKTLVVNNEPFGLISAYGFAGIEFANIVETATNPNAWTQGNPVLQFMQQVVYNKELRGEFVAVVRTENGFYCVKDIEDFKGVEMAAKDWDGNSTPYTGYVDVDDGGDFSSELSAAMEIWMV